MISSSTCTVNCLYCGDVEDVGPAVVVHVGLGFGGCREFVVYPTSSTPDKFIFVDNIASKVLQLKVGKLNGNATIVQSAVNFSNIINIVQGSQLY